MDEDELRAALREILAEESGPNPDWDRVEALCRALEARLMEVPDLDCADSVWHFVDDTRMRRQDAAYGEWQRDLVVRYVEFGEMTEHAPSTDAPEWGCLLVPPLIGLLVWWML